MSLESIASEVVADGTKSTELMIATLTYIYIYMGHSPENWTKEGATFPVK